MSDASRQDEAIARLVRSVDERVPLDVEQNIRAAAEALRPRPRLFTARWPRILVLVPGAAALALAAFLLLPALRKPPVPPISEIRTEFEIADKNIKIVFFQKPDFNLFKEE